MNITLLWLIVFSALVGAFAGLVRLLLSSKPTTARTIIGFMLGGGIVASAGVSFMTLWIVKPALCYGVSVVLGLLGEQTILLLLDILYKAGSHYAQGNR